MRSIITKGIQHFFLTLVVGLVFFVALFIPFIFPMAFNGAAFELYLVFLGIILISVVISTFRLRKSLMTSNDTRQILLVSMAPLVVLVFWYIFALILNYFDGHEVFSDMLIQISLMILLPAAYYLAASIVLVMTTSSNGASL